MRLARLLAADWVASRDEAGPQGRERPGHARAVEVRRTMERLGPFYIKVGQILATRPDFVSQTMMRELALLQDTVRAAPFPVFEQVLDEELDGGWRRHFRRIDSAEPLGSASLAQVYRVVLRDGRPAVVKVQRPGARAAVLREMAAFRRVVGVATRFASPRVNAIVDARATLAVVFDAMGPELDFTAEAAAMEQAGRATSGFELVAVPRVIMATPRMLVQSEAPGRSIRHVRREDFTDAQRGRIGRQLLEFSYHSVFIERVFHADPHPGNVFVHPELGATVIDWGMVGRIDRGLSVQGLLTLINVAQNDARAAARGWVQMGHATQWADLSGFTEDMRRIVPQVVGRSLADLNFGVVLMDVLRSAARHGIRSSSMVGIVGKAFANVEGSVRCLAPELSAIEAFEDALPGIARALAEEALSKRYLARQVLDLALLGDSALDQTRAVLAEAAGRDLTINIDMAASGSGRGLRPAMRVTAAGLAAAAIWRLCRDQGDQGEQA